MSYMAKMVYGKRGSMFVPSDGVVDVDGRRWVTANHRHQYRTASDPRCLLGQSKMVDEVYTRGIDQVVSLGLARRITISRHIQRLYS